MGASLFEYGIGQISGVGHMTLSRTALTDVKYT
jgi:hypothetical protein